MDDTDRYAAFRSALEERYAFRRELGQGGMAQVYLARDTKYGRDVAVKVLRPELAVHGPERFLREIEIAAKLNHPHILALHEAGEAEGLVYYTMPYIEGESLRDRLRREGSLPIEEALHIADEVADALAYAHERGIIHRDIKPANILLQDGHAIVSDFGIARALAGGGDVALTDTGASLGTPAYMSPEQADGSHGVDARSDIYALGCVVYEMLAGEPPFASSSVRVTLARKLAGEAPRVRTVRRSVPESLDRAVAHAMATAPADRPGHIEEFRAALKGSTGHMERRRALSRMRRPVSRIGLLLSLMVVVLFAWLYTRSHAGGAGTAVGRKSLDPARVAILPFDVVDGRADLQRFGDNLTRRLIEGLSSIDALAVQSWGAVAPYANRAIPIDSVARAIGAGTLVDGVLEGSGDSIRVRVQLIDGATGEQMGGNAAESWFKSTERLRLVDAAADTITLLLRRALGPSIERRQRLMQTDNPAAFDAVEVATSLWDDLDRIIHSRTDLTDAEHLAMQVDSLLRLAESLDPHWVEPVVKRAQWVEHRIELMSALHEQGIDRLMREGIAHANRALRMTPGHFGALEIRGKLRRDLAARLRPSDPAQADSLLAGAEADLRAAINGNPTPARALRALSELVAARGDPAEALVFGQRAYEQDPFLDQAEAVLLRLFEYSFELGRDDDARRWCEEGQNRFGDQPTFVTCRLQLLAWTELYAADVDEAWTLVHRALEDYPPTLRPVLEPRLDLMAAGVIVRASITGAGSAVLADSARTILRIISANGLPNPGVVIPYAAALDRLGDREAAIGAVRDYLARNPQHATVFARSRELRPLRGNPVFSELIGERPVASPPG
jgi:eukaryotic-like serine/threonine-protein kinase